MKLVTVFLLIILGAALHGHFWLFSQIYQIYDTNSVQMERTDFQSVGQRIDDFFSSKAGAILQKINFKLWRDQKAKLLHQKAVALHQTGAEEAEQIFFEAQASAVDTRIKADIIFNSTEGKVIKSELESAIAAYQENLKLNPEDWQAKNNLELLLQQQAESGKGKGQGRGDQMQSANKKNSTGNKRSRLFDLELFNQIPKGTRKVDK